MSNFPTAWSGLGYDGYSGVARNFFSEGAKQWVPSPAGSIQAQIPGCGLGQSSQKLGKYAKNLIVTNSIQFREKNFTVAISEGDVSHLSPFPTPLGEYDHVTSIYAELYIHEHDKMSVRACVPMCVLCPSAPVTLWSRQQT